MTTQERETIAKQGKDRCKTEKDTNDWNNNHAEVFETFLRDCKLFQGTVRLKSE